MAFGGKGIFVTVVDFSEEKGREVVSLVEKENAKFHSNLGFPSSIFIKCDVSNSGDFNFFFFFFNLLILWVNFVDNPNVSDSWFLCLLRRNKSCI